MTKYEVQYVEISVSENHKLGKDFFNAYFHEDEKELKEITHKIYVNNDDYRLWEWEQFETLEEATAAAIKFSSYRTQRNSNIRFVYVCVGEVYKAEFDEDGDLIDEEFLEAYEV